MPDFAAIVRERLVLTRVDPQHEADIRAELSAHLEDAYADARAHGRSENDAVRLALEQVADWPALTQGLDAAVTDGGVMSHYTRSLWLPGLTILGCSASVLLAIGWLMPGTWWANRSAGTDAMAATTGILLYVLFGAIGAAWSRRVGGTWRERLGAGLLPLALHVAVAVTAAFVGIFRELAQHPTHALNPQLRVLFVFVIVPGLALSMGAAPFLRQPPRTQGT